MFVRHVLRILCLFATLFCALFPAGASAVEPADIRLGPIYLAPTLDTEARYEDNLFRTEKNEKDTWVAEVAPRIQAWVQNGPNTYSLGYKLTNSTYASSHADDFTDHLVNLDLHHEFNARNVANVFGEYYDGHEERGTGLSEGGISRLIDKPVEYDRATLGGDYTFGSRESRGRLKLAAKTDTYEYQNFRHFTQYRDRDQDTLSGIFFWQVAAKTDLVFEVRAITNEYDATNPDDAFGTYDSEELLYLGGLSWDATATISGIIKLGVYDRQYDSSFRRDDDGFSWEVDLQYKPRTYSKFDFSTRRFSQETNGLGNSINTDEYSADWRHDWNSRSRTAVSLLYANDDYTGDNTQRDDERFAAEASYKLAVRRWFDLGLGYRYENRDSNLHNFSYSQNVYFISADFSL